MSRVITSADFDALERRLSVAETRLGAAEKNLAEAKLVLDSHQSRLNQLERPPVVRSAITLEETRDIVPGDVQLVGDNTFNATPDPLVNGTAESRGWDEEEARLAASRARVAAEISAAEGK